MPRPLRPLVTSQPEPTTPSGVTAVVREDHHAASHAPHLLAVSSADA